MKRFFTLIVAGVFSHLTSTTYAQISNDVAANVASTGEKEPDHNLTGSYTPVTTPDFQDNSNKNKVVLNWTSFSNETIDRFEVERSFDGTNFTMAGLVFGTEKTGKEDFTFYETIDFQGRIFYRLKMYDKDESTNYSKILAFATPVNENNEIRILNNPVTGKLSFSFKSNDNQPVVVKISNMNGNVQTKNVLNAYQGLNLVCLQQTSVFTSGIYVIELSKGPERFISKFVKQ
jgi:hypothetical protein